MEEDSGDEEDFLEEEDVEMSDDGDGPDDFMMLIQYQEEVRRDALIWKGSYPIETLPKKGRLEAGPSCS